MCSVNVVSTRAPRPVLETCGWVAAVCECECERERERVFRGGQQNCHVCVSSHRVRQEVIRAPERSRRNGVFCVPQFLVP